MVNLSDNSSDIDSSGVVFINVMSPFLEIGI